MADVAAATLAHRWARRSRALSSGLWLGPGDFGPLATVWVMAEKHDREKLIDVALDLCITQGYEATTIDQIAAAVGVTSHAVVRYFATKDAIILSIVDDIVVAVATELAQIPPQTRPPGSAPSRHHRGNLRHRRWWRGHHP
jgi:AcrR family transcriptional regulator